MIASRAHRNEPRRLTAMTLSNWALESWSDGPRDLDPGVVDEHVDAAELLGRHPDHAHDVVLVGDVALHEHVADALLADAVNAGVDLLLGVLASSGVVR